MIKVKVSRPDQITANAQVAYLVGPVAEPVRIDQILSRLRMISGAGPLTRVGLIPVRHSTRWNFDPALRSVVVSDDDDLDFSHPAARLQYWAAHCTDTSAPLHVGVCGKNIFLKFDHGLGDVHFVTELVAALSSAAGDNPTYPMFPANSQRVTVAALRHGLRNSPWSLISSLGVILSHRMKQASTHLVLESASVVYRNIDNGLLQQVRELRDEGDARISVLVLVVSALLRSFHQHGVELESHTQFMIDLRRHLPANKATLSNFVGVAPVQIAPPFAPTEIADALATYTVGHRSLTRYIMAQIRSYLTPIPPLGLRQAISSKAQVVISDITVKAETSKIHWGSETPRMYAVMQPLSLTNQISFAILRLGNELHLNATFCEDFISRDVMESVIGPTFDSLLRQAVVPVSPTREAG